MSDEKNDWLEPDLRLAGAEVARLRRFKAPPGLLERTLERVAQFKPTRKTWLIFRPITHPLARIAAVVMLMSMTVPLTDLDTVDSMGRRIESNFAGTRVVDGFERVMDGLLANSYSQSDPDTLSTVTPANPKFLKSKAFKPRVHTGV